MNYEIRDATTSDLPELGRLAGMLIRMHRGFDAKRWMCPDGIEEGYARYFGTQLGQAGVVILVAVEPGTGTILGFCYAGREDRNWFEMREACGRLHDLYVEERARRNGIGGALIREAVKRLLALGETQLVFTSAWQNTVIRDFMATQGFRPTVVEMTFDVPR